MTCFVFNIPPAYPSKIGKDIQEIRDLKYKPLWWNWQTHLTQNQTENIRAGSSPASGTSKFSSLASS